MDGLDLAMCVEQWDSCPLSLGSLRLTSFLLASVDSRGNWDQWVHGSILANKRRVRGKVGLRNRPSWRLQSSPDHLQRLSHLQRLVASSTSLAIRILARRYPAAGRQLRSESPMLLSVSANARETSRAPPPDVYSPSPRFEESFALRAEASA